MELRSHGIVPGVIQVPHGGQPIVQMRDAQPSGGYPKIATVIDADLWRLGQAPIGSRVRFIETTWEEAIAALDEVERVAARRRARRRAAARAGRGGASMPLTRSISLSAWLAATDIDVLELRGPNGSLRLERRGGRIESAEERSDAARPQASTVTGVCADTPALFLHHHPLHTTALARPGMPVSKGQVAGPAADRPAAGARAGPACRPRRGAVGRARDGGGLSARRWSNCCIREA